jgi:DNA-binding CsgD family transcriptional regulator
MSATKVAPELSFTARETEILGLISQGFTNKEIARFLAISKRTVETHLRRMFLRRGFRSRTEAVVTWLGTQGPAT